MTLYYAEGSPSSELTDEHLRGAIELILEQIGPVQRVLAIPARLHAFPQPGRPAYVFPHTSCSASG